MCGTVGVCFGSCGSFNVGQVRIHVGDARFRASFRDWAVQWSGEWERGRLRAEAGMGSGDVPTMLIPKPRVEKTLYSKICSEELIHLQSQSTEFES